MISTTVARFAMLVLPCLTPLSGANTMQENDISIVTDESRGILTLEATSHGCTAAEHFRIERNAKNEWTATRLKNDRCRRRPFRIQFEYAIADL